MSPCALMPQICVLASDEAAPADGDTTPAATRIAEHSCCSDEMDAGQDAQHEEPASPCPRGCCRMTPIGPKVDKVDAAPLALFTAYLQWIPSNAPVVPSAPAQELFPAAQTLQSLLCLWRC